MNVTANELRIGNLVNHSIFGNCKITALDYEMICIQRNDKDIKEWFYTEEYEPIPLTEEWLLKFGFEFRNTNKQYGWYLEVSKNRVLTWCHSKEISLDFDLEDYDYNNTLFDFNCEYIHRLQNLYFALTGTELTIKL
jgi:hypothetical protein